MPATRARRDIRLIPATDAKYRGGLASDVVSLFQLYLDQLAKGQPEAFTTLRSAWQQLCFSFIYAVSTVSWCAGFRGQY